jgi:hypothetical protein
MNARENGFGLVVSMPRYFTQLGDVIYVDEDGVIRLMGNLFDDVYFNDLVKQSVHTLDRTVTEEEHPRLTVALGTGCPEIKPLAEEEYAAYLPKLKLANTRKICRSQ